MEQTAPPHVITYMGHELTNEELEQLDMLLGTLRVDTAVEEPVWRQKPLLRKSEVELPLEHEAASESFLVAEMEGRVRLSDETRLMEEKRLRQRSRKRKRYARRGRFHHKSKEATKRRQRAKEWKKDPLTRLRFIIKQGVDIREDEWQRLIEPAWRSCSETPRVRVVGGARRRANVYTLIVMDGKGPSAPIVYHGPNQAVEDSMNPEYMDRVLELTTPTEG